MLDEPHYGTVSATQTTDPRKPFHDALRDYMQVSFGITVDFQLKIASYKSELYAYIKVEGREAVMMFPAQAFFNDLLAWEVPCDG